jgi:hypothetical protein
VAWGVPAPVAADELAWVSQFGSPAPDEASGVAVDQTGDLYVVGQTSGDLTEHSSGGMIDAFVRRYDAGGGVVWTRQFGSHERDLARDVDVDAAGNIYVVGETFGSLPGQVSAGGWDAFVRKYDPYGIELWTRQFGGGGGEAASDVAIDKDGNVYVVGGTRAALPGQQSAGDYDAYIRRYDQAGNERWTRQFGTPAEDYGVAVTVDAAGNPIVVGATGGLLAGAAAAGSLDSLARQFDPSGNVRWTRQFGTPRDDFAVDVAVGPTGDVLVVGTTEGVLPGQKSAGQGDAYVASFSADGGHGWTRQFGTSGPDDGHAITVDAAGQVFVAGRAGRVFPGQTSAGGTDGFVMAVAPAGNTLWSRQFGGPANDYVVGLAVGSGGLYAAGGTLGALEGQTASGERDAFVVGVT